MVKQITALQFQALSSKVGDYLIDVRTPQEWKIYGKPDGEAFGLSTYFVSYQLHNLGNVVINPDFNFEMEKLKLDKNKNIFFICSSGIRSQIVAEIYEDKGFKTYNISNGFNKSNKFYESCWVSDKLPIK
ncbi:MAG: hypothetical protein CMI73_02795 [Candidatus Pelagibacter sp.]|nr:hypothetical protein [Candidatus Pelagibacter sp.]OUV87327.1 MAG: hypothetical protein CBC96_02565 [Pelagibacteraceae bacterium TMED136]|tara:strand:+ start:7561 stop:7950 length:390 start_codon:yes stop_codon:yes gene_type:complete